MGEEVKVYGHWRSPFSRGVDIALKLKGVEYKYYEEDLSNKSASLLKYNPIHKKVPTFVHNEKPLAESLVILEYIDDTWKSHPILPQDPYQRACVRFWARFIDDKVIPTLWKAIWVKEEQERTLEEVIGYLEFLEKELKDKYFGGESIGLLDIVAIFIAHWVPVFQQLVGIEILTETKFPKLCKWSHDFVTHDVVIKILPLKEDIIAFFIPRLDTMKKTGGLSTTIYQSV
ncbi:probable glutathione S-transferase [Humulus lupulus]|uniref:probable glutathione S-transferase n=1 Tax=Humulus lupulus TaxID=3486 RepID=UPI002B418557|nr:probable glutathione S-transferase [Humulus lupulus]